VLDVHLLAHVLHHVLHSMRCEGVRRRSWLMICAASGISSPQSGDVHSRWRQASAGRASAGRPITWTP
jgi:hypothetical protein